MGNPYTALIAKVEAGEALWQGFSDYPDFEPHHGTIAQAYRGSLDAAKALHDAVLPGWFWGVVNDGGVLPGAYVADPNDGTIWYSANDSDASRAWLLAILKAKEAEHDNA